MVNTTFRGRGRIAGSLAATMALFGTAAVVASGPAHAAPPEDCSVPADISTLAKGDPVNGLTVVDGTTPTSFDGEFLGVLEDGVAPGIDMVMVEVDEASFTGLPSEVHGIWQGMSGSPVYDNATGDLIGAVAYGLAWGNSWVAGVTPFEQMDDYVDQAFAPHVKVSQQMARQIAKRTDVTAAQADQGFRELNVPLGVSGVRTSRLEKAFTMQKNRKARYLPRHAYQMAAAPAAPSANVDPDTLEQGGNMAAALSYGDITMGGVGTATSVCDGRIVGFGHPAAFSGTSTMTLHPADVIYVQGDPLGAPFKVANLGAPAGTVTDDHLTGITATFGQLPTVSDVTSTLSYHTRNRTGSSHVSQHDAAADVTFLQQLSNHDTVLDGIVKGSELQDWTITGDEDGTPFTLHHVERYASQYDIAFESPWDVADVVWTLSNLDGVTIDDVTVNGAVDDNFSDWQIQSVEVKQHGKWVKISRNDVVVARAGKSLAMRANLKDGDQHRTVPVSVDIAKKNKGKVGELVVFGGGSDYTYFGDADNVSDLRKLLGQDVRNDAVGAQLTFRSRHSTQRQHTESAPTNQVVTGAKFTEIVVR